MFEYLILLIRLLIALIKRFVQDVIVQYWPGIERPIVQVRQGKVQGVTARLSNGKPYHYFKGIPYAEPPLGSLRFRPPVPLKQFSSPVQKCLVDRRDFIQPHMMFEFVVSGTEDGLYLNVFTPEIPPPTSKVEKKLPVMVYLHGGGFEHGTASSFAYDPQHLVQQGVIVVTTFYRLGPFGFLCLPSVGVHGNYGLKDQREALIWVQENIESFGGDPSNVTLFGESAGSWATYLHYISPNSQKYFHRAICQSGDACTDSILQVEPEKKARKLAALLGFRGGSDEEIIDFLRKAPARQLAKYQRSCFNAEEKTFPLRFAFRPVIEKKSTEDAILWQRPEEIVKTYDILKKPLISGYTNNEGVLGFKHNRNRLHKYDQNPEWLVPQFMGHPVGLNRTIVGEQIKQFYMAQKAIGWKTVNETADMFSDSTFLTTANLSVEWIAKYQPKVVQYHYVFSYVGRYNFFKTICRGDHLQGASHGDDCFYLFSSAFLPRLRRNSAELRVRDTCVKLWTNFAKYSNPTPDPDDVVFEWQPVVANVDRTSDIFNLDSLDITLQPKMVHNLFQERKEFWRDLMKRYTNYI